MNKLMRDFADFIEKEPYTPFAVSVSLNGEIMTEDFTVTNPCQDTYSVAKAFTMTAVGILFDKGLLRPEDKICDILTDAVPEGIDPRWSDVTVEMLILHRAGLPGGFLDIDCNPSSVFGKDYLNYTFTYPMAYTPGTEERYSDGAYYLLSCAVEKLSGQKPDDFLWTELFSEFSVQEAAFSHCPMGHVMGATGLYLHSSDMVKLGELYLNNGIYNGKRLLSEEWIQLVLEKEYCFKWDKTHTYYYKGGMRGQKLIVYPKARMAVAVTSYEADTGAIAEWFRTHSAE